MAFLVLVGVAMALLNNAAARLTEAGELKQVALGLNEQSIAFVALEKRTKGADFATVYGSAGINCIGTDRTCYVVCPTGTSPNCALQLQTGKSTARIGTSKLQFTPSVVIRLTGSSYLVNATTSWGKGIQKQLTTARIIE